MVHCILSTDLAQPALRLALRRLLAIRDIGGYSLISDGLALGLLTIFRSSRVARPQDDSKALQPGSLLGISARSYFYAKKKQRVLRPVSEVADMETRLGLAARCVDPAFQHSRPHCVGFVREQAETGSVGFVENAVEHVFRWQKARTHQPIMVRASNRHFMRLPSGPLLTSEGLCHVEFQGTPEDAQNWFVGSADTKNAFHQMRIPGRLKAFLNCPPFSHSKLVHKKIDQTETSCFRFI